MTMPQTPICSYTTETLYSVLVEVTTFCNMRCACCTRTVHNAENKWVNQHLSLADFKRIVESLPPADEIVTQGVGEPTMHPDLPEMVRFARMSGKFQRISFTTNAMVRDESYYADLFDRGLSRLLISVDSFDPELANELRAGTDVERLKKMIANLSRGFPGLLGTRTVVGRQNLDSIPDILAELNGLGRVSVFLHPYDDMGNPSGCLSGEQMVTFAERVEGFSDSFPNLRIRANDFVPSPEVCIHPWRIPAVTVDGYLMPCCRMTDKSVATFGNMLESSFRSVWDSVGALQMRDQFLLKSHEFCKGCPRHVERTAEVESSGRTKLLADL